MLVLFLPGYTLIQAMFPRKGELDEEFDVLYRVTLGMAMSICVVILIGFILGNPSLGNAPDWDGISDGDKGYFQTFFVTSMRAKTLFKLKIDNQLNIIDEIKFLIDERIRDIIKVNDNKIVMFLENTPSLAILETR